MSRFIHFDTVRPRVQTPVGVVLGSPAEAVALGDHLQDVDTVNFFQMDMHQADRLRERSSSKKYRADVHVSADLWDLPQAMKTLLYPSPVGGERHLKIDMIEQAFHALQANGVLCVFSPYGRDTFFPPALKRVFGKVHQPMLPNVRRKHQSSVFWVQKQGKRPRRRHEVTFQVNRADAPSLRFLSRPGVFSFGQFDHGARALIETMEIHPGDRVLDIGCGCGTNGVIAGLQVGENGFVSFVDSNARAVELARINAKENGLSNFEVHLTADARQLQPDPYDVILANPPYYAEQAIAKRFLDAGRQLLKPGGRFYMVTKQPDHVGQIMADVMGTTQVVERRGYFVLIADK